MGVVVILLGMSSSIKVDILRAARGGLSLSCASPHLRTYHRVLTGSTGLIVDTLDRDDTRQFGVSGRFGQFAESRAGRSEPGEPATAIDEPHIAVVEAHDMVASLEFGDAQELASQYLADEETAAFPHDLARGAHAADLVIGVVPGILNAIRHGSLRWDVEFVRGTLAQRFVWALLVVVPAEGVKAGLLAAFAAGGRDVCALSVRCMRSCRPFSCGEAGWMKCGSTPSLIHHADRRVRPPAPLDPNGAPLSQRIESGRP